jgi:hypothetical protein
VPVWKDPKDQPFPLIHLAAFFPLIKLFWFLNAAAGICGLASKEFPYMPHPTNQGIILYLVNVIMPSLQKEYGRNGKKIDAPACGG